MGTVKTRYLSAGANRHTAVADWSDNGILAFGSDSNVAVVVWPSSSCTSSHDTGIKSLLRGHEDVVQAVRFIPRLGPDEPTFFVSGAGRRDLSLRLWSSQPEAPELFNRVQTVEKAHSGPINYIAASKPSGPANRRLVATCSTDGTVKVWSFEPAGSLALIQTIALKPVYFPLGLALSSLDPNRDDAFILVAAGSRNFIQVFVTDPAGPGPAQFSLQATLSGHEDWIRSLDIIKESDDDATADLLIASASGDKYIRLWRVHSGSDLPATTAAAADPTSGAFLPGRTPANKAHRLKCGDRAFSVTFEALLLGHEDWINSVRWRRFPPREDADNNHRLCLLSASADNSVTIWEADMASGIWLSGARLGEVSREKGATTATGSMGGFWAGLWGPDGREVVCLTRTGSWRRWRVSRDGEGESWVEHIGLTGHTNAVTGISWSRNGEYLLSTSLDQTTRLHAQWKGPSNGGSWHEMSRPQIHGYDLNCIDALGDSQFVSGADEKLMRVFQEPKAVAKLLRRIAGIGHTNSQGLDALPDAANIPVLGLSNKAVGSSGDAEQEAGQGEPAPLTDHASVLDVPHPPTEDVLARYSLWPETEKLYGHGYEISCLATSHDGSLIASACRATSANHAVIRLFETERWTEIRPPLTAHSLTTNKVRFSLDDRFILSVSRDRSWAVFERGRADNGTGFGQRQFAQRAHARMLLDGAWAPQVPKWAAVFATAGREQQVKIWALGQDLCDSLDAKFACVTTIPADDITLAVDFLPWRTTDGGIVLAVGTFSGKLLVHTLNAESLTVASTIEIPEAQCPQKSVKQLAWRMSASEDGNGYELAVAAEDRSVRLLQINL